MRSSAVSCHHALHNLFRRLAADGLPHWGNAGRQLRRKQAQIIVNFSDGAHSGARAAW